MKNGLIVGSISGVVQVALNAFLTVATVSIALKVLGIDLFGVFTLLSLINNLGGIANLGLNASLVKHLAEQGRGNESNLDIIVSFVLLGCVVGGVTALALWGEKTMLSVVLQIPTAYVNDASRWCFRFFLASNAIVLLGQIPAAVLDSMGLVYLTNGLQILYAVSNRGVVLLLLWISPRLDLLGAGTLVATFIWCLITILVAKRHWGSIRAVKATENVPRVLTKHLAYGGKIYAGNIVGMIFEPLNKLLIARFIGLSFVVSFDVALRVKGLLLSMLERLVYPLLPKLASISDEDRIRKIVEDVERLLIPMIVAAGVTTAWLSRSIVEVWLNISAEQYSESIVVVVLGYLLALIFLPFYQFLLVKGHPGKTVILQVTNVIVNLVTFAVFVPLQGYRGALVAFGLALLNSFVLCAVFQSRILRPPPFANPRFVFSIILLAVLLVCVDAGVSRIVANPLVQLLSIPIVNAGMSLVFVRTTRIIRAEDLRRIVSPDSRLFRFLHTVFVASHTKA